MNKTEQARLVERARNGDTEAFARLYSRFSTAVYFTALRMLRSEQDAMDVLQDTMVQLYQNLPRLRNPQGLAKYLSRVTYHMCVQRLKATPARISEEEQEGAFDAVTEDNAEFIPEEYVLNQELSAYVSGLVDKLDPILRSVVLLYYYEEMPVKEIARTLDLNTETVKNRLFRARSYLKEQIEKSADREGVLRAMSVPVLTQILRREAQTALTPEISARVWENVGGQLGLPAAVVAATLSAATAPGAASLVLAAGVTATTVTGGKIIAITLAAAMASGAALVGSGVVTGDDLSALLNNITVFIRDDETPRGGLNTDINSGLLPEDDQDALPPGGWIIDPATGRLIHPNTDSAETADPSANAVAGATTPAGESGEPRVHLEQQSLHYGAGQTLSAERILSDCGARADGRMEVAALELVDIRTPGEYAVFIQVLDETGTVTDRRALFLYID